MTLRSLALFGALILAGCSEQQETPPEPQGTTPAHPGVAIYADNCATCHDMRQHRTPHVMLLRQMTPDSIYRALSEGVMQEQAADLPDAQKRAVAEYLANGKIGEARAGANIPQCTDISFDPAKRPTIKDWGLDHARTRYQDPANAGLTDASLENLEVAWTIALPHTIQMRSQPGFAGGYLYMGSQDGTVYALDAKTGCQHWAYDASAEVRTSIAISDWDAGDDAPSPIAIFGDQVGNVYGVDAITGTEIWRARPHDHPHAKLTGSPRIVGDRVFVPIASQEDQSAPRPDYPCCTFRGAVVALDVNTGAKIWTAYTIPEEATVQGLNAVGVEQYGPSGASVWNTPSIDLKRNQLYVGTSNNYSNPDSGTSDSVLAIDMDSGTINWVYRGTVNDRWNVACMVCMDRTNCPEPMGPDYDMGAGTLIAPDKNGRDIVVSGQKSSTAHGIDPDTGDGIWRNTLGRGGIQGGIHFGLAARDGIAYVPNSDMVYDQDMATYDTPPRPGLFALDMTDGSIIWSWEPTEDTCLGRDYCDPGIGAPPTIIGDYVITNGLDGWVRVHSRKDGTVVWSMDTTQQVTGLNGVTGQGGSMNATGPVAWGGQVYILSGYAFAGHMPGNVLIALRPAAQQ